MDAAVRALIVHAFDCAWNILTSNRALLDEGAAALLARETLGEEELRAFATRIIRPPQDAA